MPDDIDIAAMSLDDRIRLVQDIWDSIAVEAPKPTLPLWQQEELDHRLAELERSPNDVESWEDVRREPTGATPAPATIPANLV
jgi:putative addiction module component (TIGR02574 family)